MAWVIVASMAVLTLIYLLVNLALFMGLGLQGLSQSKTAASDLVALSLGPWAHKALGLFVAIAALTSINATMIVGARGNFALVQDWHLLRTLGKWHLDRGSPKTEFWIQGLISVALIGLGTQEADGFSAMVEFTARVLGLFVPGQLGGDVVAPHRWSSRTSFQSAPLPGVTADFCGSLRLADLFQRHLCHQPESHPCLFVADGQRGGGLVGVEWA